MGQDPLKIISFKIQTVCMTRFCRILKGSLWWLEAFAVDMHFSYDEVNFA